MQGPGEVSYMDALYIMFMIGNDSDKKPLHLPVEVHLDELVINIEGSSTKKGFCVGA